MIYLGKIFRQCRLALLAFLLILPMTVAFAAPETMNVEDIKPGMKGIAKTVVNGTKIEEFGIEVIGIMKNKGASGDLILVRTFGDLIDRTGGIAQGMSGSPVYINNKLVGAVALGWSLTDHKIGMVTPISDMLKLWDLPDTHNASLLAVNDVPGFEKVSTPLMVAGFSEHALVMLQDKLKPLNLVPYEVGDIPEGVAIGYLEPGSAIGVQVVRGDVSVGALGTVTAIDDKKVLAFGHPFLRKGNSGYFMTNAYIYTTISGLENSFKVGTTGEAVGLINQDRSAGVAGQLDKYPSVIPIRIIATDNSTGKTQDAAVQVVQDEQLAPVLAATTVFNVIDKAMDRIGPGTAKVSFEITARNMPGESFKRENMFYTPASIGEAAIGEFFEAISMLANNPYHPVDIMDIKVNVAVEAERKTANIIEAQTKNLTAHPGQKIELNVKLKPFRGEVITRTVSFTIPSEQPEGQLTLEVRGGGIVPIIQLLAKQQGVGEEVFLLNKPKEKNKKFDDIIKEFIARDHNNDIVVEILDLNSDIDMNNGDANAGKKIAMNTEINKQDTKVLSIADRTNKKESKENKDITEPDKRKKGKGKSKARLATDYIISGDAQVMITVEKPKEK